MLHAPDGADRASVGSVTFAPGARTAWHTHPLGQTLVVTAGIGRVQRWGGPVEEMRVGDVVRIPPLVKHWHGAASGSAMTHLAITERKTTRRWTGWSRLPTQRTVRCPLRRHHSLRGRSACWAMLRRSSLS